MALRPRRGLTLIEVMVAMAILMAVVAVAIPSLQGVLDLQQRGSAKELAQTYTWLIDEAK
ncbi:MAG: Tfp pilus assembly protein FimT/FimU, partial [bacterium]